MKRVFLAVMLATLGCQRPEPRTSGAGMQYSPTPSATQPAQPQYWSSPPPGPTPPPAQTAPACPQCPSCPTCAGAVAASGSERVIRADYAPSPQWSEEAALGGDTISCDFRVSAQGTEENGEIRVSLHKQDPLVLTFVGVRSKKPMLKGNVGMGELQRVKDDGDEVVLVERNAVGNVFVYSISRSRRLAVWTKSYFMMGAFPYGLVLVGRCY